MSGDFSNFSNMRIVENSLAVWHAPNRVHAKKGSTAYHRRIQKKWNKRFGTHEEPCIFVLNTAALTYLGHEAAEMLVCHPELMATIRSFAP